MNSSNNSEYRPRSSSNYSWFDRLLVKLHIKSSDERRNVMQVLRIEWLVADISRRCRNIGLNCAISVDWAYERVYVEQIDAVNHTSQRHEITFNELLSDKFRPQAFVSLRLHDNDL